MQRGVILIATLLSISLLALVALMICSISYQIAAMNSEALRSSIQVQSANASALVSLTALPISSGLHCSTSDPSTSAEIRRAACGVFFNESEATPISVPLIDYDPLLLNESPCQHAVHEHTVRTPLGFLLSKGAVQWHSTCNLLTSQHRAPFAVSANLESSAVVTMAQPAVGTASHLVSSGYIDLHGALEISVNLSIAAGGDLHIRKIKNISNSKVLLSLYSSTGAVVIGEIEGDILLDARGWRGVFLPANIPLASRAPLLPYDSFIPISLTRSSYAD